MAQIELLIDSPNSEALAWREAQLATISTQVSQLESVPLRSELQAQQRWLEGWQPGQMKLDPLWSEPKGVTAQRVWEEPTLDPSKLVGDLRERLLGEGSKPSAKDTAKLRELLKEHPRDLGVRLLHLHWLDQYAYRKDYADDISDSAAFVLSLLEPASLEKGLKDRAVAFTMYRRARALAYRELPDVVEKRPLENPDRHAAKLLGAAESLFRFAGRGRQEFILLEVRMLRKQSMYGQALVLLESYGGRIDRKWAVKKRRDTLADLGWSHPNLEAAALFQSAYPDEAP